VGLERGPLSLRSKKPGLTTGGIRCADHATPSIRKSWTYYTNKRRSLGRRSSLADQSHGVYYYSTVFSVAPLLQPSRLYSKIMFYRTCRPLSYGFIRHTRNHNKRQDKVFPVLKYAPYHEGVWRAEGIAPRILNFGSRLR
jgi:hypothetical protein